MIKNKIIKKRSFLLIEILLAIVLFLSTLPFVFKHLIIQKVFLEEQLVKLQLQKIKEETFFLIEQDIKELLIKNSFQLKNFESKIHLCSQKIFSSKNLLLDVFYDYKVTKFYEYKKEENQQKRALITIDMTLFLPKKKQIKLERSLFFGYEVS